MGLSRRARTEQGRRGSWLPALVASTLFAVAGAFAPAAAQTNLNARATLLDTEVTAAGIQNLEFGSVVPGAVVNITPGPATAGQPSSAGWQFSGLRKGRTIVWTFVLPAALSRGAHLLPVDWDNAGYGSLCISRNGGACDLSSSFNPAAGGIQVSLPNNAQGNNFDATVYIGARATVPALPPGTYTAQATVFMAYLF